VNKYLAMTKYGKVKKAIKAAKANVICCSICGHKVGSHYLPGSESMSTVQITKALTAAIPLGSRKYCLGTVCRDCGSTVEGMKE